nr:hypothetical protein CFP56_61750 [Quercus suber]
MSLCSPGIRQGQILITQWSIDIPRQLAQSHSLASHKLKLIPHTRKHKRILALSLSPDLKSLISLSLIWVLED